MLKRSRLTKNKIKQRFNLKKLLGYSPSQQQKELFYELAVDKMVQRTASGKDINNENFKPYTKEYAAKKGVSRNAVDLILTGDMLNSIEKDAPGDFVDIQIASDETGKAHGNITGSYGKPSGSKAKARDFFGFKKEEDLIDVISQVDSIKESDTAPTIASQAVDLVSLRQAIREIEVEFSGFANEVIDGEN